VTVSPPATAHVGNLEGGAGSSGTSWSATVIVVVHDGTHGLLDGATVTGVWNPSGLASDTCTTGELGTLGACFVLFPSISNSVASETFTVTSVTKAGVSYLPAENHDPDGSSNGTVITVNHP